VKLELDGKEVQAILLEYAATKFPGAFDTVESAERYSAVRGVTFRKSEPVEPEVLQQPERVAA